MTGDDGHRLERDRRLVESAADPMYVTDDEGRVDICNDALAALFDRSRESLDGAALAVLLPESGPETLRGHWTGGDGQPTTSPDSAGIAGLRLAHPK